MYIQMIYLIFPRVFFYIFLKYTRTCMFKMYNYKVKKKREREREREREGIYDEEERQK